MYWIHPKTLDSFSWELFGCQGMCANMVLALTNVKCALLTQNCSSHLSLCFNIDIKLFRVCFNINCNTVSALKKSVFQCQLQQSTAVLALKKSVHR